MLQNGIHFVRLICHPVADFNDYKKQLDCASTFLEFVNNIVADWYDGDEEYRDEAIDKALSVVQAQFSHADLEQRRPLWDATDPEDVAFNLEIGLPGDYGLEQESGIAHDMDYELSPEILSYEKIVAECLPFAERRGHWASIDRVELLKARVALEEGRLAVMSGHIDFKSLPSVPSMVMNGAAIHADCRQQRDDVYLNGAFSQAEMDKRSLQPVNGRNLDRRPLKF